MTVRSSRFTLIVLILLVVVLGGCGPKPTPVPQAAALPSATTLPPSATPIPPSPTAAPTETPVPSATPDGSVTSLQNVKSATIQIEAQGSFMDPEVGLQMNAAGRGSGFIIDPSGLAVTNNHVVTGAALLKVWVGGESKVHNAKIVAVSECSDLALIDIEGSGYPFLKWYDGKITTGLDVYAAGFPLGDPEFTLTRGIVSKERASGETVWASVDYVIQHDATINPGNSGGPLVTAEGRVVGVNYAADAKANQFFAIARDQAQEVLAELKTGKDVDSIGLNGTAVNDGQNLSGIWVASVKSGSPADKAGLKPGDVVTQLEGMVLSTDGTMADYCDILRTHNPGDTLNLQAVRFSSQEVLEGQLNGRKLEQSFSFAQELKNDVGTNQGQAGTTTVYKDYKTIKDESGAMQIDVPAEWSDISGTPWEIDGKDVGAAIVASSDQQKFYDTYTTPGVFFGASRSLVANLDEDAILDEGSFKEACKYEGRQDYQDQVYTGKYDLYSDCDKKGSALVQLAAVPKDRAYVILLQVIAVTDGDLEALDHILRSFEVVGELP